MFTQKIKDLRVLTKKKVNSTPIEVMFYYKAILFFTFYNYFFYSQSSFAFHL